MRNSGCFRSNSYSDYSTVNRVSEAQPEMNTDGPSGSNPFAGLTPERLARDITYYWSKAAELERHTAPREVTMRRLYELLATNRQGLLAALQEGRPELWTNYAGQGSCGLIKKTPS